jgi:hypothetical protein
LRALFSFFIRPAVVRNAHLIDSAALFRELGRDFRLESETVFFDFDRFDERRSKSFVAGFHVGQV